MKRTAADVFSPTTATFTHRTSERPTGLALDINAALASAHSVNAVNAGASNNTFIKVIIAQACTVWNA